MLHVADICRKGTGFKTRLTMTPSGICKPMTAVAAMMLDKQNALPLDAPQSCKAMRALEVTPAVFDSEARAEGPVNINIQKCVYDHCAVQWSTNKVVRCTLQLHTTSTLHEPRAGIGILSFSLNLRWLLNALMESYWHLHLKRCALHKLSPGLTSRPPLSELV